MSDLMNDLDLAELLKELDPTYAQQDPTSESGAQKIILAVDDMSAVLNSVKAILKDKFKVVGVTSAKMASEYLEENRANLILLDIEMPDENGLVFAKKLKRDPKTSWIPIVFLTGTATQESVKEAFNSGGIDYIVKPVNSEIIYKKIDKIFKLY